MNPGRVFNPRKRWLLRKRIPVREAGAGLVLLALLVLTVGWVLAQKSRYDPVERDLSFELLAAAPVRDTLYKRPLQPWVEPGSGSGPREGDVSALAPFPAALASDGWRPGRVRRFGPDNLFEKINGEAEKFIKQGFHRLHVLDLSAPAQGPGAGERLAIELFDQGTFAGSLGIFSDHHGGRRTIERAPGDRDTLFFTTPAGAIGMRGRWFFRIAGSADTPALQARARQVVAAFSALPGNDPEPGAASAPTRDKLVPSSDGKDAKDAKPPAFALFNGELGIPADRIAYKRRNVFQYDFAEDFWFAAPAGEDGPRLFVHLAPSGEQATELMRLLAEELAYDYDPAAGVGNGNRGGRKGVLVLRQRVLGTFFALARRGRAVYGMERAQGPEAIAPWLDRLERAVARVADVTEDGR